MPEKQSSNEPKPLSASKSREVEYDQAREVALRALRHQNVSETTYKKVEKALS